jgi:hypothetical protein
MKISSFFVKQWKVSQEIIEVGKQLQYVGHKPFPSRMNGHSHIAPFRVCYCQLKSCQPMFGTLSCKIIFSAHLHCDREIGARLCAQKL